VWLIASVGIPLTGLLLLVSLPDLLSCSFSNRARAWRVWEPDWHQSIHVGSLVLFQQGIVTGSHAVGWCVAPSSHVTNHIPPTKIPIQIACKAYQATHTDSCRVDFGLVTPLEGVFPSEDDLANGVGQ